ncbi:hypothetical protein N0V93_002138 [Gnomoniopsis smithogilvyi]|uniref:Uncharacterized protein n=1 Tax=Gnomoniopsis smithogilvyi TaxID=1191159 RepID=A0A9W8YVX6_9PEZI|nr:hypothetical protein N0V93_002138 [Gnomoniopsis smithogilvyi]
MSTVACMLVYFRNRELRRQRSAVTNKERTMDEPDEVRRWIVTALCIDLGGRDRERLSFGANDFAQQLKLLQSVFEIDE